MQKRNLRIIKPPFPAIGICEHCNRRFRSSKTSQDEADGKLGKHLMPTSARR